MLCANRPKKLVGRAAARQGEQKKTSYRAEISLNFAKRKVIRLPLFTQSDVKGFRAYFNFIDMPADNFRLVQLAEQTLKKLHAFNV